MIIIDSGFDGFKGTCRGKRNTMANSEYVMSSRQAAELDYAFERNGWDASEVKSLSSGKNLALVRELIINGRLQWLEYWLERSKAVAAHTPTTNEAIVKDIMGP